MKAEYEKILDMPHHVSKNHLPMSMSNRAAQFMPFSALSGYAEAIDQAAVVYDSKPQMNEESIERINTILQKVKEDPGHPVDVFIRWFQPVVNEESGIVSKCFDKIVKIDEINQLVVLKNSKIPFWQIIDIEEYTFASVSEKEADDLLIL